MAKTTSTSPSITLAELGDFMAAHLGETGTTISKAKGRDTVKALFDHIQASASEGAAVAVRGFGTWKYVMTKARKGRNPQTGEEVQIEAGRKFVFKAAPATKQ